MQGLMCLRCIFLKKHLPQGRSNSFCENPALGPPTWSVLGSRTLASRLRPLEDLPLSRAFGQTSCLVDPVKFSSSLKGSLPCPVAEVSVICSHSSYTDVQKWFVFESQPLCARHIPSSKYLNSGETRIEQFHLHKMVKYLKKKNGSRIKTTFQFCKTNIQFNFLD